MVSLVDSQMIVYFGLLGSRYKADWGAVSLEVLKLDLFPVLAVDDFGMVVIFLELDIGIWVVLSKSIEKFYCLLFQC